ncbi:MAG: WD40/YVTN/BNR-like repeat-containing protein, partial [Blastocatellia bacterium]
MTKLLLSILFSCFLTSQLFAQAPQSAAADDYNSVFKAVKWRSIGPFRGGRSNSGCGVVGDPSTYYMGTTGGGLWKTDDMGITWRNISDGYFKTGTVGAIAVAESDANVVYV